MEQLRQQNAQEYVFTCWDHTKILLLNTSMGSFTCLMEIPILKIAYK